jgi:HK97 gp10 family phage protein
VKIKIFGAEELDRKLQRLPAEIDAGARRAVREEVDETAEDLRRDAPVLTGFLRDSIRRRIAKRTLSGTVAITAKYAEFVVRGTDDTPANDFVTPVTEETARRFPDRLRAAVRAEMRA